jgi:hypothetical protein
MPTSMRPAIAAGALAVAILSATALTAYAGPRDRGDRQARAAAHPGYVYAESNFGHGSISGPVRPGPRGGWEVRLPRGTWIDCGRDCADTLRRQTVDIWENMGRDGADQGSGYLSRSWWRD